MNRGARRAEIFVDDESRLLFLTLLGEIPERFHVRVHGYSLMPNHYHLMLESVTGNLSRAMSHISNEYTRRLNRRMGWDGALFRGRFHNRIVGDDAYWRHLLTYLHLNPVRAGLSLSDQGRWTSHRIYLGTDDRPDWLTTEELQGLYGTQAAYNMYYSAVLEGLLPPEDFKPDELWAPNSTGTVAIPQPALNYMELADALAAVSRVTGQAVDDLLDSPVGRNGNPANWLAAWWMSHGCAISHGRIAAMFNASQSTVSRRIRRVEERKRSDLQLADWIDELRKGERGRV